MRKFLPACGMVATMSVVLVVDSAYGDHFSPYVARQTGPRAFAETTVASESDPVPEGIEVALADDQSADASGAAGASGELNSTSSMTAGEGAVLGVSRTIEEVAAAEITVDGALGMSEIPAAGYIEIPDAPVIRASGVDEVEIIEVARTDNPAAREDVTPDVIRNDGSDDTHVTPDHAGLIDPVTPATPADPVVPVDPVNPGDPVNPADPANPGDPADPTNPTNPATGEDRIGEGDDDEGETQGASRPKPADGDDDEDDEVNYRIVLKKVVTDPTDYTRVRVYFDVEGLTATQQLLSAQLIDGRKTIAYNYLDDGDGQFYLTIYKSEYQQAEDLKVRVGVADYGVAVDTTVTEQYHDMEERPAPEVYVPQIGVGYYQHNMHDTTMNGDFFAMYLTGQYQSLEKLEMRFWNRKVNGYYYGRTYRHEEGEYVGVYVFEIPKGIELYHGMPIDFTIEGTVVDSDGVEQTSTATFHDIVEIYNDREDPNSGIAKPMPDEMAELVDENGHYIGQFEGEEDEDEDEDDTDDEDVEDVDDEKDDDEDDVDDVDDEKDVDDEDESDDVEDTDDDEDDVDDEDEESDDLDDEDEDELDDLGDEDEGELGGDDGETTGTSRPKPTDEDEDDDDEDDLDVDGDDEDDLDDLDDEDEDDLDDLGDEDETMSASRPKPTDDEDEDDADETGTTDPNAGQTPDPNAGQMQDPASEPAPVNTEDPAAPAQTSTDEEETP